MSCANSRSISELENRLGGGLIEEVIQVAEGEHKLVDEMIKHKVYVTTPGRCSFEYLLTKSTVGSHSKSRRQRASGSSSNADSAVTPRRSTHKAFLRRNGMYIASENACTK